MPKPNKNQDHIDSMDCWCGPTEQPNLADSGFSPIVHQSGTDSDYFVVGIPDQDPNVVPKNHGQEVVYDNNSVVPAPEHYFER